MLLRSSSTPILNSWLPKPITEPSPEHDLSLPPKRTKSLSLTRTCSSALITSPDPTRNPARPPVPSLTRTTSVTEKVAGPGWISVDVLLLAVGGGGGGCGGGGGGGRGSDGGDGFGRGCDGTDAYYRKMIEANPGNGLLLGNYAKFLKEVRGDLAKAEEYCGRAILTNPNDTNLLSLYADLIWESKRDADRAETYFVQAVKTDRDDCYVMASYARFLWDAEEEEEEEDDEEGGHRGTESGRTMSPRKFKGASHHQPSTTAS